MVGLLGVALMALRGKSKKGPGIIKEVERIVWAPVVCCTRRVVFARVWKTTYHIRRCGSFRRQHRSWHERYKCRRSG